jgi:HAMP domain-containing protein
MLTTRDLWLLGAVALVLLGGCLLETWRDARAGVDRGTILKSWALVLMSVAILAGALLGARFAHARDLDGLRAHAGRHDVTLRRLLAPGG